MLNHWNVKYNWKHRSKTPTDIITIYIISGNEGVCENNLVSVVFSDHNPIYLRFVRANGVRICRKEFPGKEILIR